MANEPQVRELVRQIHTERLETPIPFEAVLIRSGALHDPSRIAIIVDMDLTILAEHDQPVSRERYDVIPRDLRTAEVEALLIDLPVTRPGGGETAGRARRRPGRMRQSVAYLRAAFTTDIRMPFLAAILIVTVGSIGWWWGYRNGVTASRLNEFSEWQHKMLIEAQKRLTPSEPDTEDTESP